MKNRSLTYTDYIFVVKGKENLISPSHHDKLQKDITELIFVIEIDLYLLSMN
jgi:hypothetical protein